MGRETAVQLLGFFVQLGDRILIAALLLRLWGVEDFAAWSLIVAAGGMVAFFDMGVNLYFANRVLFLVQQGRRRAARVLLRAGNALMIAASAIGVVAVAIGFAFVDAAESGIEMSGELWLAALFFALAAFLRLGTTVQMSIYRAHEAYARQTMMWILIDLGRIVATVAVVLLGGSFVAAAAAQLLVSALGHLYVALVDSPRQFPHYPFAVGPLPRRERRQAATLSLGYWLQSAPNSALMHLPVFLLSGAGSAFALAQFVLMRTLSNFVRAVLQPFAVVFAQESARRLALGDAAGVSSTYREATFLLGALGAVPAAVLLGVGPSLFTLWTEQPALYSQWMMVLAIAPPLLIPSLTIAQSYLATVNDPWPIAVGRALQLGGFALLYVLLPIEAPGLRMMAALAIAEPLSLGIALTHRIRTTVAGTGLRFHVEMLARLGAVCAGTWAATRAGASLSGNFYLELLCGLAAGGAAGALLVILFGLGRERRAALLGHLSRRLSRRSA